MHKAFRPRLPLPVADATSRGAANDVETPTPAQASLDVRKHGSLFAEPNIQAVRGIDDQFQKDASTGCNARLSVLASSMLSCRGGHKTRRGILSPGAAYNSGNKRDLDRIIGVLSEYFRMANNRHGSDGNI